MRDKLLQCLGVYSIEEVFGSMDNLRLRNKRGKRKRTKYTLNGAPLNSSRMKNFKLHGITCVSCGVKGNFFAVEKHTGDTGAHLNLYAVQHGGYILMTKDHIKPLAEGGKNCIHNYQPMCANCNNRKDSSWNKPHKIRHFISFIKHKLNGTCKCSFKEALENKSDKI